MRLRFLPLPIFAVIEGLIILSMINAPAPLYNGIGGYSHQTIALSVILGVILGVIVVTHVMVGWLNFKVHRILAMMMGALCAVLGAQVLKDPLVPRVIFMTYGGLLILISAFVEEPTSHQFPRMNLDSEDMLITPQEQRQEHRKSA